MLQEAMRGWLDKEKKSSSDDYPRRLLAMEHKGGSGVYKRGSGSCVGGDGGLQLQGVQGRVGYNLKGTMIGWLKQNR